MKITKKLLSALALGTIALTITSCDAKRNSDVPQGNLNLQSVYATNGTQNVSYNEVYNQLRNRGYGTMIDEIKHQLFAKETEQVKYEGEVKEDIDKMILAAVFGTDSPETFEKMEEKDVKSAVMRFVDNQYSIKGVTYTDAEVELILSTKVEEIDGEKEFVCNWPSSLIEDYKYTIATIQFAEKYVESICNKEKIKDQNGKDVENQYYIDEDVIKNKYTSIKDFTTTADLFGTTYLGQEQGTEYKNHAIVIKFDSLAQAEFYIEKAKKVDTSVDITDSEKNLTEEDALNFYMNLYNVMYLNQDELNEGNLLTHEGVTYTVSKDDNDFTSLSTGSLEFIKEQLSDYEPTRTQSDSNETCYLSKPWNVAGESAYYMMFRYNVYEGEEWDELENKSEFIDSTSNYYKAIKSELLDEWATESLANTLINKMFTDGQLDIKIYDPIYENQYAAQYEDYYKFSKGFNNDLVFEFTYTYSEDFYVSSYRNNTVNGKWTVDKSFETLEKANGAELALDLLASKYVLAQPVLKDAVPTEVIDGYRDGVKNTIKKFQMNKSTYSKKMGLKNYLVLTYGYDNIEDIINYRFLAADVKSEFNSYYGQFADAEGKFVDTGLFENFKTFTDKAYDKHYSLDIIHMLICIDMDNDGTYENPEDLGKNGELTTEEFAIFEEAVRILADCLAKEANEITVKNRIDAFKFLADSFNNEGKTYYLINKDYRGDNGERITWTEFKAKYLTFTLQNGQEIFFDLEITAENLSTINNSNGSNYVEPFTNEVKALYDVVKGFSEDELETLKDKGYWKYSDGVDSIEKLTETNYGYHMLCAVNYEKSKDAKWSVDNDYIEGTENGVNVYKYQNNKILVDSKSSDTESDDVYVYVDAYSNAATTDDSGKVTSYESKLSERQLFIYFFEKTNKGSIVSLPTKVETAASSYFGEVMSRYTSSNFQKYRLYLQMGAVTFATNPSLNKYEKALSILRNQIDNYQELTQDDLFYGWFTNVPNAWTVKF